MRRRFDICRPDRVMVLGYPPGSGCGKSSQVFPVAFGPRQGLARCDRERLERDNEGIGPC